MFYAVEGSRRKRLRRLKQCGPRIKGDRVLNDSRHERSLMFTAGDDSVLSAL